MTEKIACPTCGSINITEIASFGKENKRLCYTCNCEWWESRRKPRAVTSEEFTEQMRRIADGETQRYPTSHVDTEARHCDADDYMCEVLRQLGYSKGVKIFAEMKKWYA